MQAILSVSKRRVAITAVLGLGACFALWALTRERAAATPDGRELESIAFPDNCDVDVEMALGAILSHPEAIRRTTPSVALGGVLGDASERAAKVLERIVRLTKNQSLADVSSFRLCSARNKSDFVVVVSGRLLPGALEKLAEEGSKRITLEGVRALSDRAGEAPFFVQARDGTILVASNRSEFARAVTTNGRVSASRARAGTVREIWLSLAVPKNPKGEPGLGMARRVDVQIDMDAGRLQASLAADSAESATVLAGNVRMLLSGLKATDVPPEPGVAIPPIAMLARHARVSSEGSAARVDSELDSAAVTWLSETIVAAMRWRPTSPPGPARSSSPSAQPSGAPTP